MEYNAAMTTTVTRKSMVTIPAEIARLYDIKPGYRLDWLPSPGADEIIVRVVPDRAELGRRLKGSLRAFSPGRDAVAELLAERDLDG
jgi:bifunctional DNA-binding transcriptional regulator/antitoxin component of YhaV-PrlF toxin-antitoxin module